MGTVKDKACPDRQRSPPSPEGSMKSRGKETCGGNIPLCAVLRTSGSEVSGSDAIIPWITGDHPVTAHSNMHSGINRNLHRKTSLSKRKIKKQIAKKPNKDILVNYEFYLLIAKVIMKWCPPYDFSLSLQNHSLYSSVTVKQTLTEDQWAPSANTEIKGAEAEQSLTGNFRVKKHPRSTTKYSTNLTACSSLFHVRIPSSLPLLPFYQQGQMVISKLTLSPSFLCIFYHQSRQRSDSFPYQDWKELLLKANTIIPPFSSICPTSLWLTARAVPRIALITI